jgi:hypothetical protein
MRKLIATIGFLYIAAIAMPCYADGNAIMEDCNAAVSFADSGALHDSDDINFGRAGYCLGLVQGITQLNKYYELMLKGKSLFCTPSGGIKNGQAARIVVKYLRDHPEKLHEHESFLVIEAFREAYPCK